MCRSTRIPILGICHLVRLLYFVCYKYASRKRIVKTSGSTKLRDFSLQANYTDRATVEMSEQLVPTFANEGCHVVSTTDPHGREFRFSRPGAATFLFK
jgi:hypothetical protein